MKGKRYTEKNTTWFQEKMLFNLLSNFKGRFMSAKEIQQRNTLRLIALSTTDHLIKLMALSVLEESEDQVIFEISKTCWNEDLPNLRSEVLEQFGVLKAEDLKVGMVIINPITNCGSITVEKADLIKGSDHKSNQMQFQGNQGTIAMIVSSDKALRLSV